VRYFTLKKGGYIHLKTLFLFLFIIAMAITGCEKNVTDAPSATNGASPNDLLLCIKPQSNNLTIMTRNVYVGTDVDMVLAAEDINDIPFLVAEAFQMLLLTNFPARAEALANEIAAAQPHLIGLQEISTIRTQSPGDAVIGGTIPAETILYDYLQILMTVLQAKGLNYQVAGLIQNADVEMPMFAGMGPEGPLFDDVRLTDFDVVLARDDVRILHVRTGNYEVKLEVPTAGISVPRGYVIADVKVNRREYCFVNTHLEPAPVPELLPIQLAQAQELVKKIHRRGKPVILVGDFNSVAPDGETYQFILSKGCTDTWPATNPADNGYTYGHDLSLMNETAEFYERIDFVFLRDKRKCLSLIPVNAEVVGDEEENRTAEGLWPSDHSGVVVQMDIPWKHKHLAHN
jgi:endonuclease/exonuclease/phosphatase family metal-dependent hydrolase